MSHIQFFTFTNPAEDATFDDRTVSRDRLKENMKSLTAACSHCHVEKSNNLIKRCSNISRYCSPECQKADWPAHKQDCSLTSNARPIEVKLAERAAANDTLMEYLEYYAILLLDLIHTPENAAKYAVHVVCGTAPADIEAFMRKMIMGAAGDSDTSPAAAAAEKVILTAQKIEREPLAALPQLLRDFLQRARQEFARGPLKNQPVVIFYFTSDAGGHSAVMSCRCILPPQLKFMANDPMTEIRSTMLGTQRAPVDKQLLKDGFNNTIRLDKQNKFKLRANPQRSV